MSSSSPAVIEHAARAIVRAGAFATNVQCLNTLFSMNGTAASWASVFGGPVHYGQGAMSAATYADVSAVQARVDALRGE